MVKKDNVFISKFTHKKGRGAHIMKSFRQHVILRNNTAKYSDEDWVCTCEYCSQERNEQ